MGLTATARSVSGLLQLLFAARLLAPTLPATRVDPWPGFGQDMEAVHAGHGGWADGPRLELARSPAVPRAALAVASGSVRDGVRPGATGWSGLTRRHVSTRPPLAEH